jgi:hypothetical protein
MPPVPWRRTGPFGPFTIRKGRLTHGTMKLPSRQCLGLPPRVTARRRLGFSLPLRLSRRSGTGNAEGETSRACTPSTDMRHHSITPEDPQTPKTLEPERLQAKALRRAMVEAEMAVWNAVQPIDREAISQPAPSHLCRRWWQRLRGRGTVTGVLVWMLSEAACWWGDPAFIYSGWVKVAGCCTRLFQ